MTTLTYRNILLTSLYLVIGIISLDQASAAGAPWIGNTLNGAPCTDRGQGFGPFDYTQRFSIPKQRLEVVEKAHFVPNVRNLVKGNRGSLAADINYTLKAWPNHHQALVSISKYQFLHKQSSDKRYRQKPFAPIECYFQRAIHFSPGDMITHMLYAIYLHKAGFVSKAESQYQKALELSPDNRSIHYNYGLLLASQKKYDQARKHAEIAYQAGYPLPGLKKKLQKAGYWRQTQDTTHSSDD